MIEVIPGLPDDVFGINAKGTVTAKDYETVVVPGVQAMLARHRKGRLLYVLGEQFEGFEAAAVWEDTKIGLKHLGVWDRVAVVTDRDWIQNAVKVFRFLLHMDVRIFDNKDMDAARDWVCEGEGPNVG